MKVSILAAVVSIMLADTASAAFNFLCEGTSNEQVPVVIQGYYRQASNPKHVIFDIKASLPTLGESHIFHKDQLKFGQRDGMTFRMGGARARSSAASDKSIFKFVLEVPYDYFEGRHTHLWKQGFAWVFTYETGYAVDDGAVLVCRSWHSR